jgi:hypothetical protein
MPVKGLTQAEIDAATAAVVAAGGKSTDRANRLPGETATEANARITAAYKNQPIPELTKEGKAAGATMEFVRTGAGGVGTYKEIYPIGTPIPTQRTTEYGNVYDAQGKLVSGTGLKTGVPGNATAQGAPTTPATPIVPTKPATTNLPFFGNASTVNLPFSGNAETLNLNTAPQLATESANATARAERQSAYDLLYDEFNKYGLASLVEPLKRLITSGASPAEFTIELRNSPAYQKRFAANAKRIANGLAPLSESDYLGVEDQYQNIMRNYGLPESYYARTDFGTQSGFEQLIANDVSNVELDQRISAAQKRVLNANPEVLQAIKDFYGDSITNGDILAYTLNPTKGLEDINRKITAAEIGGAAVQAGLNLGRTAEDRALYAARAAELGAAGITKQQAQQGFQTVAEVAPRGGQLAAIYGESPYTQQTAEQEVFGLAGSVEAAKQRKKLTELETAAFGGRAGAGVIARDRAGVL